MVVSRSTSSGQPRIDPALNLTGDGKQNFNVVEIMTTDGIQNLVNLVGSNIQKPIEAMMKMASDVIHRAQAEKKNGQPGIDQAFNIIVYGEQNFNGANITARDGIQMSFNVVGFDAEMKIPSSVILEAQAKKKDGQAGIGKAFNPTRDCEQNFNKAEITATHAIQKSFNLFAFGIQKCTDETLRTVSNVIPEGQVEKKQNGQPGIDQAFNPTGDDEQNFNEARTKAMDRIRNSFNFVGVGIQKFMDATIRTVSSVILEAEIEKNRGQLEIDQAFSPIGDHKQHFDKAKITATHGIRKSFNLLGSGIQKFTETTIRIVNSVIPEA